MKRGNVLLGFLGGVAVGTLLGILLAPDKGERTRRKIVKKGENYVDTLKDKFDDILEEASEKFESAVKEATNAVKRTKAKANSMADEVLDKA
ncbi:MAG: YtxH domain-containing protein [Saprospiraceae bacterium]|nr:YtxH domain-containing protein [Saprospiraceae bacterium]